MSRLNVRRLLTGVSLVAIIMGGATAPAMAVGSDSMMPACWWSRCQGKL